MAYELLWFLRGETNINWLKERGVGIWNAWADEKGDLESRCMALSGVLG